MNNRPPDADTVTVFGSNSPGEGDEDYDLARRTGRRLAELGYRIANGGYGGTMEASARGAREAGGSTVGVVCSVWSSRANSHIDSTVETSSLLERLDRLIEFGDGGYVVLPGATGTLVELATVWEMSAKRLLSRRPMVCMGGFWRPVLDLMAEARPGCERFVAVVEGPEQLGEYFRPVDAGLR